MRYVLIMFLLGCTHVQSYEPNLPLTRNTDTNYVCARVVWNVQACPPGSRACIVDRSVIYTVKPKDWSDWEALFALGHEFFHALGASHEHK